MVSDLVTLDACELTDTDLSEAAELTPDEAEQLTGRIRQWANAFPAEDVVRAYRGRVWVALAYSSWSEWCECELGGLKLPVPQRREVVAELAGSGLSNTAIADVMDVSKPTVARDLSGVTNVTPEVTGQDGKTYPRPKPAEPDEVVDAEIVDEPSSELAPRRKPLVDSAREIGLDLAKMVRRLEDFGADDRLVRNKNEVAPRLRHHLDYAIKVCQDLNQQLSQ